MEYFSWFMDIMLHLDRHLDLLVSNYGKWTYLVLFLIVFCETGLVVTPFLPGDSLLFAAGAIAGLGSLQVENLIPLLIIAAILGDTLNYHIGAYIGPKVFSIKSSRLIKVEHLHRTQKFYEKHGGKTIIIARFIPIVRTFAPFVAGVGTMSYGQFLKYNVIGAIAWVTSFVSMGYWFGQREIVKQNFSLVILAIIILSILPAVIEYIRAKKASN